MTICSILLSLLFSLGSVMPAQPGKIDSLQNLLKTAKADTNTVNTLILICTKLIEYRNFDSALVYSEKARILAEKIQFKNGIGTAEMALAVSNYNQGHYSETKKNASKALTIFEELNNKNGMANALLKLGGACSQLCEYTQSLEYLLKALDLFKVLDNKRGITYILTNIGLDYYYMGNYSDALDYQLKALAICQGINDKQELSNILGDIGSDYGSQGDHSNALKYYTRALKINQEINDKISIAHDISNIGNIYKEQGNDSAALSHYLQALAIFRNVKYDIGVTLCMLDLGDIYKKEGNYPNASENYYGALTISKKINYKRHIAKSYTALAGLDILQKRYKEAAVYFDSSLTISMNIGVKDVIQDSYEGLFQLDSAIGNYKGALENLKNFYAYKDSMVNEANQKKMVQAEMTYEFEQKQAIEKAEQDKKDAIRNAEEIKQKGESKTQRILIGLVASISIVLVLLVILVFQRMKEVEKKKLFAEQQKAWLELKALRTQMNPHFLYNTINSIQSFVLKNDTQSSFNYLTQFANLMRGVLENSRKDKITLVDEIEVLSNYLDFEIMRFPSKFNYQIKVDEGLDKTKTLLPPLLIQPYVENAIWHGLMHLKKGLGQVNIIFEKVDNHIKCTIDDNGIGRKAAAEIKNKSIHKSLGMSIVAERMESMNKMYNWDMKVEIIDKFNEEGIPAGTKVELYLPLILNTVFYD